MGKEWGKSGEGVGKEWGKRERNHKKLCFKDSKTDFYLDSGFEFASNILFPPYILTFYDLLQIEVNYLRIFRDKTYL